MSERQPVDLTASKCSRRDQWKRSNDA